MLWGERMGEGRGRERERICKEDAGLIWEGVL